MVGRREDEPTECRPEGAELRTHPTERRCARWSRRPGFCRSGRWLKGRGSRRRSEPSNAHAAHLPFCTDPTQKPNASHRMGAVKSISCVPCAGPHSTHPSTIVSTIRAIAKHTSARRIQSVRRTAVRLAVIPMMQTTKMMIPVWRVIPYASRCDLKLGLFGEITPYNYRYIIFLCTNPKKSRSIEMVL